MEFTLRRLVGLAIRGYRATPLYPAWGVRFARILDLIHRISPRGPFVHDLGPFRMELDLSRVLDSNLYYEGHYEPDTVREIEAWVHQGQTAIDVGANVGFLSLVLASRVGSSGMVLAFEPMDWAFRQLDRNLDLNRASQVRAVRLGLGDARAASVPARISVAYKVDGTSDGVSQPIEIDTLDEYLARAGIARVDFIKIDTDGMEARVLRGARKTVARFSPVVHFELGPDFLRAAGDTTRTLLDEFSETIYEFRVDGERVGRDALEQIVAKMPPLTTINVLAVPLARRAAP